MKKFILSVFTMLIVFVLFAQDTTSTGGGVGGTFDSIVKTILVWAAAALAILEVIARAIPSSTNWAPLTNIVLFLNKILSLLGPNKTADGQKFVVKETIQPKNDTLKKAD